MSISLPIEKRNNISNLIDRFRSLQKCTIREFSQLIGVLVSACPALKYGWLYTKILERQKYLALKLHNSYDKQIKLTESMLPELEWWRKNIISSTNTLRPDENFVMEIFSDASRTGWGAFCNGARVNGSWTDEEYLFHINYLELLAIFMSLKCFARDMSHCSILLRVDNTTAISYINRMGGIQFPHLNDLAKSIWCWCEERNVWLFASYINTKENTIADEESRKLNLDTEWELSDWAFQKIVITIGNPEIDLFASRTNTKCQKYISWKRDPEAFMVDAFTINWDSYFFYAFPPFSLILKCLRKIIRDSATGILVFPYWPGQAWFPLLQDLLASEIITFKPSKKLLLSRFRQLHPLHRSLTLISSAARLYQKKHTVGRTRHYGFFDCGKYSKTI
ncbi:uncharacterized protein LOC131855559 [Achroia grisella]|uniref:uncharacterized protein LOC131855559 n=1 Tax=Achroia grisella TaxID=688607 RepID=UPI0027D1FC9D|nr:uncharacterized protein LOC131855559 [Achroia grisella]